MITISNETIVSEILFRQLIELRFGRDRLLSVSHTYCSSLGRFGCNYLVNDHRRLIWRPRRCSACANAFFANAICILHVSAWNVRTDVAVRRPDRFSRPDTGTYRNRPAARAGRARVTAVFHYHRLRQRTYNSVRPVRRSSSSALDSAQPSPVSVVSAVLHALPLPKEASLITFPVAHPLHSFTPNRPSQSVSSLVFPPRSSGRTVSPLFFTERRPGHRSQNTGGFTVFFKLYTHTFRTPYVPVVKQTTS